MPAVSLLTLVWTGVGPPATHLLLSLACCAGALVVDEKGLFTFTDSLSHFLSHCLVIALVGQYPSCLMLLLYHIDIYIVCVWGRWNHTQQTHISTHTYRKTDLTCISQAAGHRCSATLHSV